MVTEKLNIVSFNIPYPADYGGVIDVFYKIKYLHQLGIKIILHTFEYGRSHSQELNKYCDKVYYYKRSTGILSQLSHIPYIVYSRRNNLLLNNLCENDYPILFEGLQCCYYLNHKKLANRKKIVRVNNIEHEYYLGLNKTTASFSSMLYFKIESWKLKAYERQLQYADCLLSVSETDSEYFKQHFGERNVYFFPPFHQCEKVTIKERIDSPYLLFHGDLSVEENISAAIYLIESIAINDQKLKLIIAGKQPSNILSQKVKHIENVELIANPSDSQMTNLVSNAAINILYVKHAAGTKLKLINSLYKGRFCIANEAILQGSSLSELCIPMPDSEEELLQLIHKYYEIDFDQQEIEHRSLILGQLYDNITNAKKLLNFISNNDIKVLP